MAAADRLSALQDRVLRRILSFLHAGEAARTSALSRRWRGLWLQADAVNLETGSYWHVGYDGDEVGRLMFRDAKEAVHASGRRPVRRLSVRVASSNHMDYCEGVMRASPGMDEILAAPATRGLEELRLRLHAHFASTCDFEFPTRGLPCAASLRVLELAGCTLGPPPAAVFPRLDTLSLTSCMSPPDTLQAVLDAAPSLMTLRLDGFSFTAAEGEEDLRYGYDFYEPAPATSKRRILLRCPTSTAAVTLLHCHGTDGVYLDTPGARFVRYKGFLEHFPFSSAATPASGLPANLQHVELRFCTTQSCGYPPSREKAPLPPHAVFWESIGGFNRLRFLKLKLLDIHDIAVPPEQEDTYLNEFPELKFLELKEAYEKDKHGSAVALANFLHCCPAMQGLRLKFKGHGDLYASPKGIHLSEERRAQVDLEKSMELLKRLKSGTSSSAACYDVGEDDRSCDNVDLLALQARSFHCLESHLRKIRLKFELKARTSTALKPKSQSSSWRMQLCWKRWKFIMDTKGFMTISIANLQYGEPVLPIAK